MSPECDYLRLEAIARKHWAVIVTKPEDATHIITKDRTVRKLETPDEFVRSIRTKGPLALVHWWYYPDSYDNWIDANEVQGDPETDSAQKSVWKITDRFLYDTDMFNEWMNEIDYELEEDFEVQDVLPKKRTFSEMQSGADMLDIEEDSTSSMTPSNFKRTKRDFKDKPLKITTLQPQNIGTVIQNTYEHEMDESNHVYPSLVLPSKCEWFNLNEIHQIEKNALPEFFADKLPRSSSRTPAVYKEYRDFMINTYQLNPNQYLTATACRRSLAGDAMTILK